MLPEQVSKLSPVDRFVYWCRERHQIHLRRESGAAKPWTDDPVLQRYFFTNPYRENDKVTRWFREAVRDPLRNDSKVWFATVCFRWFNWPPTGNLLGRWGLLTEWDTEKAVYNLTKIAAADTQVFTGAFNISNSGSTKPKVQRVCEDYIAPAWECRHQYVDNWTQDVTMEEMHTALMQLPGLGGSGFMAYEVVCDLRYTYMLEDAPDKCTWSNMGPGAKRGLNRLHGRDIDAPVSRKQWAEESTALLALVQPRLARYRMPPFEMREIEHSLCEYDKYERARLGEGHMKRTYDGGGV